MSRRGWIGSILLLGALVATGGALAAWKYASIEHANAAAARSPSRSSR